MAFRYSTVRAAHSHSITGSVRNLSNGDVEVYAQGTPENIQQFEKYLHKGPPLARVAKVIGESFEKDLIYEGFEVF